MRNTVDELSARQSEIARMVAAGKSSREIGAALYLSRRTVENHIAAIFAKLGVTSRVELTKILLVAGPVANAVTGAAWSGAAAVPPTNLPSPRTSLLGREREVKQIAQAFADGRLVTVTGAGGVGKTRAAIAAAQHLLPGVPDGAWLVDFAPMADGALAASTIAHTLEIAESPRRPFPAALVAQLRAKRLLLVLDNCEHVIDDAAAIADTLLRDCAQLFVLATSREPLRIAGEQVYRLPSLAFPADERGLTAAAVQLYPAVMLFAGRAAAVDRSFAITDENAASVAEVCRRLDGIPLAIELAAARMNTLTAAALAARLDSRFALLTRGDRAALPRHQTMRALVDWSYDLLDPREQRLFERLWVFAGGCDLAAAAAIDAEGAADVTALARLSSLVDKSLLIADVGGIEPRYRLLESTRQYAREKLAARGETDVVARRHAQTYADLAEQLDLASLAVDTAPRALPELENWRAALTWSLQERNDVELGLRLAAATKNVWTEVSHGEGRRWAELAARCIDERTPLRLRMRIDIAATGIAYMSGDWDAVIAGASRTLPACRQSGAQPECALLLFYLGATLVCVDRAAEGEPLLREVLATAQAHGYRRLAARALEDLAHARSLADDLDAARAFISEARDIWQAQGEPIKAVSAIVVLAEAEFAAGNADAAYALAADVVAQLRSTGMRRNLMTPLINVAAYAIARDRWAEAAAAAREALGLSQDAERVLYRAWAVQHLAAIALLSAACGPPATQEREAVRLLGYVDARVGALDSLREYTEQQEYDRVRAVIDRAFGRAESERLLAAGAALDERDALERALALILPGDGIGRRN